MHFKINTGTRKRFFTYLKIMPTIFMNFTTHPYHLTEQQLKLCHVRDPSTDTVTVPALPHTWRTYALEPVCTFEAYEVNRI